MRQILCCGAFSTLVALGCSQANDGAVTSPTGGASNSSNSSATNAGGQTSTGSSTTSTTRGGSGQSNATTSGNGSTPGSDSVGNGGSAANASTVGGSGTTDTGASGGTKATSGTTTGGSGATSGTNKGGAGNSGGTKTSGGSSLGGTSASRGGSGGTAPSGGGSGKSTAGGTSSATGGTSSTSSSSDLAKSQCDGKPGPSYADFFDNTKLATLKITVDAAAMGGGSTSTWLDYFWTKWSHCSPFNYIKTQFAYESPDSKGNVTCQNVGMRLRGSKPRGTNQTQGFKLDMQVLDTAATTHRRFADENRINFLSIESDPSHMIQCLSYKVLRDYGLPAPLCNHLKVYVNGAYYGLLENVEQVNRGFVRRHFGSNAGSLYAASPSMSDCGANAFMDSEARLAYSGDSFSTYKTQYRLEGTTTAADAEKNLIPMLKCGDATQTANDADFKKCIADWIDVNEWLKQIAAESLMPTLESWIGYYRNYYLYFNPDSAAPHGGKFAIWSWDLDAAFHRIKCYPTSCDPMTSVDSLFGPRNARAKLVLRLTSVFKTEYCAALKDFANTALASAKVDAMAKVIEPAMSNEPSVTSTAWQAEVTALRDHFSSHNTAIKSTIATACP